MYSINDFGLDRECAKSAMNHIHNQMIMNIAVNFEPVIIDLSPFETSHPNVSTEIKTS